MTCSKIEHLNEACERITYIELMGVIDFVARLRLFLKNMFEYRTPEP